MKGSDGTGRKVWVSVASFSAIYAAADVPTLIPTLKLPMMFLMIPHHIKKPQRPPPIRITLQHQQHPRHHRNGPRPVSSKTSQHPRRQHPRIGLSRGGKRWTPKILNKIPTEQYSLPSKKYVKGETEG